MNDSEIKIKTYGLINFTKKQYITTQTVVFALLVTLIALFSFVNIDEYMFGNARLFIIIVGILEVGETFFILRSFKRKSKQRPIPTSGSTLKP